MKTKYISYYKPQYSQASYFLIGSLIYKEKETHLGNTYSMWNFYQAELGEWVGGNGLYLKPRRLLLLLLRFSRLS